MKQASPFIQFQARRKRQCRDPSFDSNVCGAASFPFKTNTFVFSPFSLYFPV